MKQHLSILFGRLIIIKQMLYFFLIISITFGQKSTTRFQIYKMYVYVMLTRVPDRGFKHEKRII